MGHIQRIEKVDGSQWISVDDGLTEMLLCHFQTKCLEDVHSKFRSRMYVPWLSRENLPLNFIAIVLVVALHRRTGRIQHIDISKHMEKERE